MPVSEQTDVHGHGRVPRAAEFHQQLHDRRRPRRRRARTRRRSRRSGGGGGTPDNSGVGGVSITPAGRQDVPGSQRRDLPARRERDLPAVDQQTRGAQHAGEHRPDRSPSWRKTRRSSSRSRSSSKFIEITQNNLKELSFDWTLGQANVPGSTKVFFGGGTAGTGRGRLRANFPFDNTVTGDVVGSTPVTAGNRSGTFGISANAIDALLFGGAGAAAAPGIFSVAGVFTDPQFQLVVRALNQQKGVDLLSAPRVTTKSGQKATIEIIREFIYPTQFQPPQIPQNFGSHGGGITVISATGRQASGGSHSR